MCVRDTVFDSVGTRTMAVLEGQIIKKDDERRVPGDESSKLATPFEMHKDKQGNVRVSLRKLKCAEW